MVRCAGTRMGGHAGRVGGLVTITVGVEASRLRYLQGAQVTRSVINVAGAAQVRVAGAGSGAFGSVSDSGVGQFEPTNLRRRSLRL